jgi:F-type H+-transporting ATPase subunit b
MEGVLIDWKILVGQTVNFLILFFLMKKLVFPRFFSILEERQKTIEKEKRTIEELEEKKKEIEIEKERILNQAKEKAELILREAKEKAKKKEREILEMAEKEKEKIIEEARKTGEEEIERMKKEFLEKNIETVLVIAEKFLEKKIDPEKDKRIILSLLKELEKDEE